MTDKQSIRLPERFDFSFHKTFNTAYEPALTNTSIKELELDFSLVQYLDSSALGMLVLLAKSFRARRCRCLLRGRKVLLKILLKWLTYRNCTLLNKERCIAFLVLKHIDIRTHYDKTHSYC